MVNTTSTPTGWEGGGRAGRRLLVHWRWSHLKITPALVDVWQDLETSHSKSSLGNFQNWYLADMLASVYSYRVMVKSLSVSSCCVRGRRVLSNPVTYVMFWFSQIQSSIFWFSQNQSRMLCYITYVTGFERTRLPRTQQEDTLRLFTITR